MKTKKTPLLKTQLNNNGVNLKLNLISTLPDKNTKKTIPPTKKQKKYLHPQKQPTTI
tara:strand:+ start:738 stop:908 length:171 start_codon:yes stop_codon:yes gene_type:complete